MNGGITNLLHYLDDFLTMGADREECARNLEGLRQWCAFLGFPLALEKVEGPATILVFLGILLDSVRMELRLPPEKLSKANSRQWWPNGYTRRKPPNASCCH